MNVTLHASSDTPDAAPPAHGPGPEFGFIPDILRSQCRSLIQTYHAMHGYACLPDMLWKAGLGGFIEKHRNLSEAFKKASTTRSARKANGLFVIIATEVLSLEILAREYANWSAVLPAAKVRAIALLEESIPGARTWLMEHYLYPPRYDSPAAAIALAPASVSGMPPCANDAGLPVGLKPVDVTRAGLLSFREIMQACRAQDPVCRPDTGAALAARNSHES
ncbi:hypothetical protein HY68_39370 [Streptomyces sp. AcH 505]|uniref:hypothetical protein n=1 Tax=Streptomyces sp. AcH 505 TaxID=352211 RepID=UPI000591F5A6|nr:hypothetical protein HY68_39370 [Streptomyces sp. AcH 505]